MRYLILVVFALVAAALIYGDTREKELPPGFQAALKEFGRQVDEDIAGPKGESARIACQRIAGVSVPARTVDDVINAGYSSNTAEKYVTCLVNHMYPVDAKKDEEYRRKTGLPPQQ